MPLETKARIDTERLVIQEPETKGSEEHAERLCRSLTQTLGGLSSSLWGD